MSSLVSLSFPGLIISMFELGSNSKMRFFKLSAAVAPAAFIKTSESSLLFPSTTNKFKLCH